MLCLLATLAAACTSKSEGEAKPRSGPPAMTVQLGVVRGGSIEVSYPLLGEVRSTAHAELAAGEEGEVMGVSVHEGDHVKAGQLLVAIDPSLAKARLHATAAQRQQVAEELEQAARDAKRLNEAGNRLVAEREIEQAQSQKSQLAARTSELGANLREAKAVLSRLRVVAPFDGQVKTRSVDPGDWVHAGDPVIELVATDSLEVIANAPADLVPYLHDGDHAQLRHGDDTMGAEIGGVVRALDETTRTARVRMVPAGQAPWLLPGGTVDVVFTVRHQADGGAVIVPRDAIVMGAVGTRVVRAVSGKAQPIAVQVLATSDDEALVRGKGLASGQKVVTRGNEHLRPGEPLQVLAGGGD